MRDAAAVEALLYEHHRWAKDLVGLFKWRYPAAEPEGIESAVMLGFWQAARNYDGNGSFTGYARWIIEKRVLDEIRTQAPLGRMENAARSRGDETYGTRKSRVRELHEAVPISLSREITDDHHEMISLIGGALDPGFFEMEDEEFWSSMLARLPEREYIAIFKYYFDGLTLREIGEILGVVESRVSQLQKQALQRLRTCPEAKVLVA